MTTSARRISIHLRTAVNTLGLAPLVLLGACAAPIDDGEESSSALEKVSSAYTNTDAPDCTVTNETDEGSSDMACAEMGGYSMLIHTGDDRQMVSVRTSVGDFDLKLYEHFPAPGYLGPRGEWRGKPVAIGKVEPAALIFRYFEPTPTIANKNYLVVAKVTPEAVCIYAKVDGNAANGNVRAREEADKVASITCPVVTPRPRLSEECGTIAAGKGLGKGDSVSSCSGSHTLVMQTDGNLVLYNNKKHRATWQSKTVGTEAQALFVRPSGEVSLFGATWNPLWSATTTLVPNSTLRLQDDGNLVLYSPAGKPVFATMTQGR